MRERTKRTEMLLGAEAMERLRAAHVVVFGLGGVGSWCAEALARSGLTSLRVSLNSARPEVYERYYRPHGYSFGDVRTSIAVARRHGIFVSLNLLFFPGITDTEAELEALARLVGENGVSMIQWRNLNIDPDWYWNLMEGISHGPSMSLAVFMKRLRRLCPWLRYGYFNPYVGDKAELTAPLPGEWSLDKADAKLASRLPFALLSMSVRLLRRLTDTAFGRPLGRCLRQKGPSPSLAKRGRAFP